MLPRPFSPLLLVQLIKWTLMDLFMLECHLDLLWIYRTIKKNHESDRTKEKCKLYIGSQSSGYRRDYMELLSPLKNGVIVDWNIVDNIWDHALRECLLVDPKERPMLLAEQCSNTQEQRERAAELMFEKYKVPALFLAKNAVLTSFASGRATSLVVDRYEIF
ncbi:hypothetical protein V8G54_020763 [Vigna mungo]|uniref:Actin-related protein 4 n=1 Tax=Vigna mungo TaxID=3915 RepID=A0AAQ3NEI8_VIGMU